MSWQFTPYTLFLLLAAGIVFGLAFLLRRHRHALGAGALAVMMLAAGLWDLGAGLELSAADHFYKVLWAKLQYLGIVAIPVAWLAFAVVYTGRESWLSRRNLALLCVVPAITLLLVATNEYHGLIWSQVELTRVSASIGLALAEAGDHSADDLLRKADSAMYEAKNSGKSRLRVFSGEAQ